MGKPAAFSYKNETMYRDCAIINVFVDEGRFWLKGLCVINYKQVYKQVDKQVDKQEERNCFSEEEL